MVKLQKRQTLKNYQVMKVIMLLKFLFLKVVKVNQEISMSLYQHITMFLNIVMN